MMEEIVAEIPIRDREVHRITRCEEAGRIKVRLRRWFQASDGQWRPSPGKGYSIRREHVAPIVGAVLTAGTKKRRT